MYGIAIFSYLSSFCTIFGSFMKGSPSIFISEEKTNYYSYCTHLTTEIMDVTVIIFTGTTRNYNLKSCVILSSTYWSAKTNEK